MIPNEKIIKSCRDCPHMKTWSDSGCYCYLGTGFSINTHVAKGTTSPKCPLTRRKEAPDGKKS